MIQRIHAVSALKPLVVVFARLYAMRYMWFYEIRGPDTAWYNEPRSQEARVADAGIAGQPSDQ
jgi:hypothetical protein